MAFTWQLIARMQLPYMDVMQHQQVFGQILYLVKLSLSLAQSVTIHNLVRIALHVMMDTIAIN